MKTSSFFVSVSLLIILSTNFSFSLVSAHTRCSIDGDCPDEFGKPTRCGCLAGAGVRICTHNKKDSSGILREICHVKSQWSPTRGGYLVDSYRVPTLQPADPCSKGEGSIGARCALRGCYCRITGGGTGGGCVPSVNGRNCDDNNCRPGFTCVPSAACPG